MQKFTFVSFYHIPTAFSTQFFASQSANSSLRPVKKQKDRSAKEKERGKGIPNCLDSHHTSRERQVRTYTFRIGFMTMPGFFHARKKGEREGGMQLPSVSSI